MNTRHNAQLQIEIKETRVEFYNLLQAVLPMRNLIDITEERHHLLQETRHI